MLNKSAGQMYDWVTHTHAHIRGECQHGCSYCYMAVMRRRFSRECHCGEARVHEPEFAVNYGSGRTIFVENCNDMFASKIPDKWILRILAHCRQYPDNTYVFQSKNPERMLTFESKFPPHALLGTTAETDALHPGIYAESADDAPPPVAQRLRVLRGWGNRRRFITLEPLMKLANPEQFANDICDSLGDLALDFINIGVTTTKLLSVPDPTVDDLRRLMATFKARGATVRRILNLDRIKF